jgi:hypothetical protein
VAETCATSKEAGKNANVDVVTVLRSANPARNARAIAERLRAEVSFIAGSMIRRSHFE